MITAKREGSEITVDVSEKLNWNIRKIGAEPQRIEQAENRAVIILNE